MGVIDFRAPDWLGEFGKAKFEEIVKTFEGGYVPGEVREQLVLYCEAYDDLRTALDAIQREGATCVSDKGNTYQNPAVGIKNKAITRMRQFGPILGWAEGKAKKQATNGVAARKRK